MGAEIGIVGKPTGKRPIGRPRRRWNLRFEKQKMLEAKREAEDQKRWKRQFINRT